MNFHLFRKALTPAIVFHSRSTNVLRAVKPCSEAYLNTFLPLGARTTKTAVKSKTTDQETMTLEIPQDRVVQLTRLVDAFLRSSDLSTVSVKKVRTHLANQVTYDILPYKQNLAILIQERFDEILDERERNGGKTTEDTDSSGPSADSPADTASPANAPPPVPKKKGKSSSMIDEDARFAAKLHAELNSTRTRTTRASTTPNKAKKKAPAKKVKKSRARVDESDDSATEETAKKKRKINRNNPFNALQLLSEPLSALVSETALSRPETVKRIWAYVKSKELQDPNDKRFIVCDDRLHAVFKTDRIHMFSMNKVLSSHFSPLPPEMQPAAEENNNNVDAIGSPESEATSPGA